jgi:predicted MFS family arabinose efflux permease
VLIRSTLFVETAVLGLLALSRSLVLTVVLLALEGANYGITIALAQLTIVAGSERERSASSLVWYNAASSLAQLAGGGLVALLVTGHTARGGIVVVMVICLVLACTYAVTMTRRRRRASAPSVRAGAFRSAG